MTAMTDSEALRRPAFRQNPFPNLPEVTAGLDAAQRVTVRTDAVQAVRKFVDDHLRYGVGRMLAIVGDYGIGKSHLASLVIWQLMSEQPAALPCVVQAQRGDTVAGLYQRIFRPGHAREADALPGGGLQMLEVRRRVEEICTDLEYELGLRDTDSGRPVPTVSGDLELLGALQDRLLAVTGDGELAAGLSLLLHADQDIADNAWGWLSGGPVTRDLHRRGVLLPIGSEPRALVAMLGLARLLNRPKSPFALIVDEVDQLGRDADARYRPAAVLGQLATWAADSGTLLVVAVSAKTWDRLPEGVLQRAGDVVRPGPWSPQDIAEYVRLVYRDNPFASRPPFAQSAISRLHDITGGSPRQVVDACYHAVKESGGRERITAPLIARVSGEIFMHTSPGAVAEDITRVCTTLGERAISCPARSGNVARLWIPVGTEGAEGTGITIVVSGPVVTPAAAAALIRLARESAGAAESPAILVCAGPLAGSLDARLRDAFKAVLRAAADDFLPDLSVLIGNLVSMSAKQAEVGILQEVRDELRRLRAREYQQGRDQAGQPNQDEQRLREVIRQETRRAYLRSPSGADDLDFGDELPRLQAVFDGALDPIRVALDRAEQLWRSLFASPSPTLLIDRSRAPGARGALPADLTPEPMISALGVLVSLDSALRGLGHAVLDHIHDRYDHPQASEQEQGRARRGLLDLCTRLDQTVEQVAGRFPDTGDDPSGPIRRALGIDRGPLLALLRGLGGRVYLEVYINERVR
jgi:hypothetical protein